MVQNKVKIIISVFVVSINKFYLKAPSKKNLLYL